MSANPAWLDRPSNELEERFAAFHAENPHIASELEERAVRLLRAGRKRIGVKMIVEALRYDWAIRTDAPDYKINNSFASAYARLLIFRRPELAEVIEVRRSLFDHEQEAAA